MRATSAGIKTLQLRHNHDVPGVRTWRDELIGSLAVMPAATLELAKTLVPHPSVHLPKRFDSTEVGVAAIEAIDEALGLAIQLD